MGIHDRDQEATGPLALATPRRHRRTFVLGGGALAVVLATTTGIMAGVAGRSSPATQAHAQTETMAGPSSIAPASAAKQRAPSAQVAPNSTTSPRVSPVLADGTYPTYIDEVDDEGATITIDVVQVFEDEAAVNAAIEDGMAPGEARYLYVYIRNQNPRLRTLPLARDLRIQFVDPCESSADPQVALMELARQAREFAGTYYYDVTVVNGSVHEITQNLAVSAC